MLTLNYLFNNNIKYFFAFLLTHYKIIALNKNVKHFYLYFKLSMNFEF